jgi:hypothetical protein
MSILYFYSDFLGGRRDSSNDNVYDDEDASDLGDGCAGDQSNVDGDQSNVDGMESANNIDRYRTTNC